MHLDDLHVARAEQRQASPHAEPHGRDKNQPHGWRKQTSILLSRRAVVEKEPTSVAAKLGALDDDADLERHGRRLKCSVWEKERAGRRR